MSDTVTKQVDVKVGTPGAAQAKESLHGIGHALHEMNVEARRGGLHAFETILKGAGIGAFIHFGAEAVKGMAEAWKDVASGVTTANEGFFKMAAAIPILGSVMEASKALGEALYAANHAGEVQAEHFEKTVVVANKAARDAALLASRGYVRDALRGERAENASRFMGGGAEKARNAYEDTQDKIYSMRSNRADFVKSEFELLAKRVDAKQITEELDAVQKAELDMLKGVTEAMDARIEIVSAKAKEAMDRGMKAAREAEMAGLKGLQEDLSAGLIGAFSKAKAELGNSINAASVGDLREKIKTALWGLEIKLPGLKADFREAYQAYFRKQSPGYMDKPGNLVDRAAPVAEGRFLSGASSSSVADWQQKTAKNTEEMKVSFKLMLDAQTRYYQSQAAAQGTPIILK